MQITHDTSHSSCLLGHAAHYHKLIHLANNLYCSNLAVVPVKARYITITVVIVTMISYASIVTKT